MTDAEKLEAIRAWGIALIDGDDTTHWGSHEGASHGLDVLRLTDNKTKSDYWDARNRDWVSYE